MVAPGKATSLSWTLPANARYSKPGEHYELVFQPGATTDSRAFAAMDIASDGEPFLLVTVRVRASAEANGKLELLWFCDSVNTPTTEVIEASRCSQEWQTLQLWVNIKWRPRRGRLMLGFTGTSGEASFDLDSLTIITTQGIEIPAVTKTPQLAKDIETLRERLRKQYLLPKRDVTEILQVYQPDGTFKNVVYQDENRSYWLTMRHLDQTLMLAQAWANPESKFHHDARTAECITGAFAWWVKNKPANPNWWWNEIALPVRLTHILLLTPELIPASDRKAALELCRCFSLRTYTGQNLVDAGVSILDRGVVENDPGVITAGVRTIQSEIRLSPPPGVLGALEGIRADGCYHQHGPQIQFGGYGLGFLGNIATWATLWQDTNWALTEEQWELMRHLVFNGYQWVLWKGRMDLLVGGRHMQGDTGKSKANAALNDIRRFASIDTAEAEGYQRVLRRNTPNQPNDLVGSRWFWNSDLMVHRRPEWMAVMRACSTRVHPMEDNINQDCALGRYFADGTCLVYRHGEEYLEMPAVWDWTRLPGTTLPATPVTSTEKQRFTLSANGFRQRGFTAFVGGATDGIHGCAIYSMSLDDVEAQKAYFFDEDAIYELGAGITSRSPYPVATTVNSCRLCGEVRQGDGWAWHDGIGYLGQGLEVTAGDRTGDERVLAGHIREESLKTLPVFHLQIDHGLQPQNAEYGIAILPDVSPEETAGRSLDNILANTPDLQAIRLRDGTIAAVFHIPGAIGDFSTQSPGVFLIHEDEIFAADPTQQLATLTITYRGIARTIELPDGDHAGTTVRAKF